MPFDAIFMSCLRKEIEGRAVGHKVDKVQQPDRDHFLFNIRTGKLLVSLNSSGGRTHFTDESFENPQTPPMFCMLLRKHLIGGRVISVTQPGLERSFDIEFETYDALGIPAKRHLIIELLGRYTNLIITDGDGIIIDCVRRIGFDVSDKRQVLPGLLYRLPPQTGKLDPFECDLMEEFEKLFDMPGIRLDKWLNQTFDGFSPLICREIVLRAYGRTDCISRAAVGTMPLLPVYNDRKRKIVNCKSY